jgi:hypothetical protein
MRKGMYEEAILESQAFVWLNRAVDESHPAIPPIKSDPDYESLFADPRFGELLRRVAAKHY